MNGYDLIYYRRSDGQLFNVKRLSSIEFILLNPLNGEKEYITKYKIKKDYRCDYAISKRKSKISTKTKRMF